MIDPMDALWRFYRKTWWLWLAFVIVFALLGYYVIGLFYIFIPGLIAYSAYFGIIRGSEMAD
jgi:hypothetical protein